MGRVQPFGAGSTKCWTGSTWFGVGSTANMGWARPVCLFNSFVASLLESPGQLGRHAMCWERVGWRQPPAVEWEASSAHSALVQKTPALAGTHCSIFVSNRHRFGRSDVNRLACPCGLWPGTAQFESKARQSERELHSGLQEKQKTKNRAQEDHSMMDRASLRPQAHSSAEFVSSPRPEVLQFAHVCVCVCVLVHPQNGRTGQATRAWLSAHLRIAAWRAAARRHDGVAPRIAPQLEPLRRLSPRPWPFASDAWGGSLAQSRFGGPRMPPGGAGCHTV